MPEDLISKYQRQLLDQAQQTYHDTPISAATVQAFLATPRHAFVRRYRERASKEWHEVNAQNLSEHLVVRKHTRSIVLSLIVRTHLQKYSAR